MLKQPVIDPSRVYPRPKPIDKDADMLSPDYLSVAAVLFSFSAMYLRVRVLVWLAVFSLVSSFLTRATSDFDRTQTIISSLMTSLVLYIAYTDESFAASTSVPSPVW
jgi:hypothetical protein